MWSAFMNGSGLHGGGGAGGAGGGGYVPSQGWEFVPCTRMDRVDRGRSKARTSLRRVSSPPTVFSQLYETQLGASPGGGGGGGGEGEAGKQLEILRGQMWPGQEPAVPQQQPQQTQHTRLKKKLDDLKKRHVQDKEEWMREKESLLREVADIQVISTIHYHVKTRSIYKFAWDFKCLWYSKHVLLLPVLLMLVCQKFKGAKLVILCVWFIDCYCSII